MISKKLNLYNVVDVQYAYSSEVVQTTIIAYSTDNVCMGI